MDYRYLCAGGIVAIWFVSLAIVIWLASQAPEMDE